MRNFYIAIYPSVHQSKTPVDRVWIYAASYVDAINQLRPVYPQSFSFSLLDMGILLDCAGC